ncbi:type II toxin-antitoxin system ParD family antitoxin [Siccirubricoccus phaeus]|uniref:type II toxin-antitoxin system ParD family antitoxin n=1 Tax=Siccirubricoccus phaeus TaxID=2595053 RepID=UPI0011F3204E|nr:type II toxin-antitoxin system ParD family antitoxin [Siccirubricoccus phaeus]
MTDRKTLTIPLSNLDEESRRFIDRMIAEGRHRTAQEVVDEALRRYMDRLAAEALARATGAPRHGDYRQATVPPEPAP